MRLANMLKQPGGVSEQGREVVLRLRHAGPAGVPTVRDLTAVMLPLSEVEREAAERLARETAAKPDAVLPEASEAVIRVLQASLRDQGDMTKLLIEDETDLQALRTGLVGVQYQRLLDEYKALIETEYPLVVSPKDEAAMEREARDFSSGDQPPPG